MAHFKPKVHFASVVTALGIVLVSVSSLSAETFKFGFYLSMKKYDSAPYIDDGLYILQVSRQATKSEIKSVIEKSKLKNHNVILRMPIFRDESGNKLKKGVNLSNNDFEHALDFILDRTGDTKSLLLSLDEENVPWDGRLDQLSKAYKLLKRETDFTVYQWYSASKRNNAPGSKGWPVLEADGWIFDQYRLTPKVYEEFVRDNKKISNNLVSVLWLSPNWNPNTRTRKADSQYWNNAGFDNFIEKLKINIDNGIPTVFFSFILEKDGRPRVWWDEAVAHSHCAIELKKWLAGALIPILNGSKNVSEITRFEC